MCMVNVDSLIMVIVAGINVCILETKQCLWRLVLVHIYTFLFCIFLHTCILHVLRQIKITAICIAGIYLCDLKIVPNNNCRSYWLIYQKQITSYMYLLYTLYAYTSNGQWWMQHDLKKIIFDSITVYLHMFMYTVPCIHSVCNMHSFERKCSIVKNYAVHIPYQLGFPNSDKQVCIRVSHRQYFTVITVWKR